MTFQFNFVSTLQTSLGLMSRRHLHFLANCCFFDKVYQLLAQGRWFSPGTPSSSTTKTGRHDIVEILLKVALNTKNSNYKGYKAFCSLKSSNLLKNVNVYETLTPKKSARY
jgi:hypothetical protein